MSLLKPNEDMQYFLDRSKTLINEKKVYCEQTIRLLSKANEIAVTKQAINQK